MQIPHTRLIEYIKYKSILNEIKVIEVNESYTSKVDALANEPVKKQDKYLGRRISCGLFLSSLGKIIRFIGGSSFIPFRLLLKYH